MNSYSSPSTNKLGEGKVESPLLKVKITPVSYNLNLVFSFY